jgi:deoxyribose-phosphate aldolase
MQGGASADHASAEDKDALSHALNRVAGFKAQGSIKQTFTVLLTFDLLKRRCHADLDFW